MEESLSAFLIQIGEGGPLGCFVGLFFLSFFAATLLPLGSELWLLGLQASGNYEPYSLLAIASVGNILGSIVTYKMGEWGKKKLAPQQTQRYEKWINKYGGFMGLFAWLPVVGDPLALSLGYLKTSKGLTYLCFSFGKTARYAVVMGLCHFI